jgi:hypothetical protein
MPYRMAVVTDVLRFTDLTVDTVGPRSHQDVGAKRRNFPLLGM